LCDVTSEQKMEAGERFGMIRFGSRVDVYLPLGTSAFVVEGQQSVAGETVLADLNSSDESRRGEKR
jgi:phosphatidylserine decarboxylase